MAGSADAGQARPLHEVAREDVDSDEWVVDLNWLQDWAQDWGGVVQALAAIGTLIAVGVAVATAIREGRRAERETERADTERTRRQEAEQRAAREERERQARRVFITPRYADYRAYELEVHNRSQFPIYDVVSTDHEEEGGQEGSTVLPGQVAFMRRVDTQQAVRFRDAAGLTWLVSVDGRLNMIDDSYG